jgi:LuxR family maltose regulon positive regulatory protein
MHRTPESPSASAPDIRRDIIALFAQLGLDVIVRDPATTNVVAATPSAERRMLASEPGTVRIAEACVAGTELRVELLPRVKHGELTERQQEVADLLMEGMRNQEIAEALGLSLHTVRRHMEQIFQRLGVNNRHDAADVLRAKATLRSGRGIEHAQDAW